MPKGKSRSCKVCDHEEAETIRREAVTGSPKNVALKYSMSPVTVHKCIKEHEPEKLRQSVGLTMIAQNITTQSTNLEKANVYNKMATIVDKEGWNEEVQRYANDIDDSLAKLKSGGQIHLYTNLGHVKVKLLELQGKALNVFAPDTAIQINNFTNSEDYKKLKQIIIQTLIDYPEALEAVGEAIKLAGL